MESLVNKFTTFTKKHIGIILTIFFDLYAFYTLKSQLPNGSNKTLLLFLIFCVITNVILFFIIRNISKLKDNINRVFLLISIPLGLLYVIMIPVFAGTDEPFHFFRAYQISQGTITVDNENYNTQIPKSLLNLHYRTIKENYVPFRGFEKLNKEDKTLLPIKDASSQYSPVQYFPQIFGIKLGEVLNLSPMAIVILSRLFSFIVWCVLTYYAIKKFPYNKLLFTIICLAPSLLSLVSTTSGDTILNAFSFLLISYCLSFYHNKNKLSRMDIFKLLLLCVGISLCKTIYIVLVFIITIIPYESFGTKKRKWFYIFLILGISFVADITWITLSSIKINGTSNSTEQLKYILSNPIDYIFIICRTFLGDIYYYVINLFSGSEMCYSDVKIPSILSIAYVAIVYLSLSFNENIKELKKVKYLFYGIFIIIFGITATTMYINWTNTMAGIAFPYIIGVQSRYFIMLVPLLLITFKINQNFKISKDTLLKSCAYLNVYIMLSAISSLIIFYN